MHPDSFFTPDEDGDTDLHIAAIKNPDAVRFIISQASSHHNLNVKNHLRQTPLHLSIHAKLADATRYLVVGGASITVGDSAGNTPLHLAAINGSLPCFEALTTNVTNAERHEQNPRRKTHLNLDITNHDGFTCVHLAAFYRNFEILDRLKSLSADLDAKDHKSGRTVLHHAVETGNLDLVEFLIKKCHVDVNARTFSGYTALTLAVGRDFNHIALLLAQSGGIQYEMSSHEYD